MFTLRLVEHKCPSCKKTYTTNFVERLRVGREQVMCRYCKKSFRASLTREWAHLSPKERKEFFFTEDLVGVLVALPLLGGVIGFMMGDQRGQPAPFIGVLIGLSLALMRVAPAWAWRMWQVKRSLQRCPEKFGAQIEPESSLPWRQK